MSIEKKLKAKFAELSSDIEDHFDELKREIERRFGRRHDGEEVFRALSQPAGLSMTLGEALARRRSERNFSNEPLPDPLLANLLYAADGINRPNGRRTTPSAFNWRETEIYVLKPNGIWRWVPERNGLIFCSPEDLRPETHMVEMPLAALPPVILVYVTNFERTRDFVLHGGNGRRNPPALDASRRGHEDAVRGACRRCDGACVRAAHGLSRRKAQ